MNEYFLENEKLKKDGLLNDSMYKIVSKEKNHYIVELIPSKFLCFRK